MAKMRAARVAKPGAPLASLAHRTSTRYASRSGPGENRTPVPRRIDGGRYVRSPRFVPPRGRPRTGFPKAVPAVGFRLCSPPDGRIDIAFLFTSFLAPERQAAPRRRAPGGRHSSYAARAILLSAVGVFARFFTRPTSILGTRPFVFSARSKPVRALLVSLSSRVDAGRGRRRAS